MGGVGGDERIGGFLSGVGGKAAIGFLEFLQAFDRLICLLLWIEAGEGLTVGFGEGLQVGGDRELTGSGFQERQVGFVEHLPCGSGERGHQAAGEGDV